MRLDVVLTSKGHKVLFLLNKTLDNPIQLTLALFYLGSTIKRFNHMCKVLILILSALACQI
jgi:hypothetical protein